MLDGVFVNVVEVGPRRESLDVVSYEVEIDQCLVVWKEVERDVGGRSTDNRGETVEGDGFTGEFSGGPSKKNHLV